MCRPFRQPTQRALAAMISFAALAGPAGAANLLDNGSFEYLANGSYAKADYTGVGHANGIIQGPDDYLLAWRPVDNGYEHFSAASPAYSQYGGSAVAQDGSFVVDLAPYSYTGGGVQQVVNLNAGTYALSFWASTSALAGRSGTGTIGVTVLTGSPSTQQYSVANATVNVLAGDWQQKFFTFSLASAAPTTIMIWNGENPNQHFAFVDNVELAVAPVPEPHEWAMMLAGLGVVGVVAGRRRASAAGITRTRRPRE